MGNQLTTRMVMAFIPNLTIAYTITVCLWIQDDGRENQVLCQVSGYSLQYFLLSYFLGQCYGL